MAENQQMTVVGKLKEILRMTRGTQKELAGKLGVSPKTMSFWLNGKKRPSVEHERNITELYRKTADLVREKSEELKEMKAEQAKKATGEEKRNNNLKEKEYYEGKAFAMAKDKGNNSKIYLFPGLGGKEDEWYMALGRSMLLYKIVLAPRLGRKSRVLKDTDDELLQDGGVVSVKWGEELIEGAKKLGYEAERTEFNVIVINLLKEFTEKEIGQMRSTVNAERNQVKAVIKPKQVYPNIIYAINELAGVLPSKVRKLHRSVRDFYGRAMMEPVVEMTRIYYQMANGRMEKRDAKIRILEETDNFAGILHVLDEAGLFDITARMRMGQNVVKIQEAVEAVI